MHGSVSYQMRQTLWNVDVTAFLFKHHNDFLHQTVDGSIRGSTEKNACPPSLGGKTPHWSSAVTNLAN